jgi:chromosome segregation ATPase
MDQKQVEKRLAWLDEQHRGSTTTLKELSDLLAKAQKQVQTQAKQIADLNDEISRLTGLTTRIHEVDETLKQHRKEVSRQLESAEQRRTEKEANIDSIRKADQQAVSHRVDQIQEELKRIKEIDQTLTTRRDEELRLSKQAAKLDKQVEKLLDKSTNQGDQLKSLIRENAKLLKDYQNIKAELDALRKKGEESRGMLDALKDGSRSLDVRVSELISAESERSEGQARWIERQELSNVEFENVWKKWGRRFEAIEQQADAFDDRLAAYEEMHRALKQMRTELGELMERLERRITEVSEMQRLSDNRMKHEWSSFQAEDLKRWNTYKLTGDELWREHNRLHDQLAKQYEAFSEDLGQAGQNIKQMLDADRMRLGEFMSMAREWLSDYTDRDD